MHHITFGKHRNDTWEEVLFHDPQYAGYVAADFSSDEPDAEDVRVLMKIASSRQVITKCNMLPTGNEVCCDRMARYVAIHAWDKKYLPDNMLFSCEECKNRNVANPFGIEEMLFVQIAFEALRPFQLAYYKRDYHLNGIARKYAEAWGVLDNNGRLSKIKIEEFFEND